MVNGTLIAESIRVGSALGGVTLTVRSIRRSAPDNVTESQPSRWTLIEFEAEEAEAESLATSLAAILDDEPLAWYVDFHSPRESFVVFPGVVFRYPRGDASRRREAEAHALSLGIPDSQLDWPD